MSMHMFATFYVRKVKKFKICIVEIISKFEKSFQQLATRLAPQLGICTFHNNYKTFNNNNNFKEMFSEWLTYTTDPVAEFSK